MAKPPKVAYELSDAEKRDLVQLIQQGKALPEKYRFMLFEDKREVELTWNGKTRDVCTTVLPFQSLEQVGEPRKEGPESPQFGLFDFRSRQLKGWTNKLIWGDNKLIYIDPPFDVGAETFHKELNLLEQIADRAKKDKFTLQIELTDFSVCYTQGLLDAVTAELKVGKSDVVCDLRGERGQLIKVSKNKQGVVTTDVLTKHWTDWVDYWAVDFDYMSRKEIIKVAKDAGSGVDVGRVSPQGRNPTVEAATEMSGYAALTRPTAGVDEPEFEERWTGSYSFENEWQSFRTRWSRDLELSSAPHAYTQAGRYTVAVKVIDSFGNDTIVPVNVG